MIADANEKIVSSCCNFYDKFIFDRDSEGKAVIRLGFPEIPLLRGKYWVSAYLFCEQAIHIYDAAVHIAEFEVSQPGLELGMVSLNRKWKQL